MKFYSTKKQAPDDDFKTALFNGLAPDGGLYMPRTIPRITKSELKKLHTLPEVGFAVLRKWLTPDEISDRALQEMVTESFDFTIPLVTVGKYSILELFHGPTMAFKDIAARVLARLFEHFLLKENRTVTILVATSGDTGGAIAQAFSGMKRVKVVVLFPEGKVSELQFEQLTRVDDNVLSIEVAGTFDDCQAFVKKAFQDTSLKNLNLSSANSINIGRLLPQIIYYFWAYVQFGGKKLRFVVPSGNMGNVTACVLAYKMGLPIDSLIIATNENDVAVKYYKTGKYTSKKSVKTLSTAMDIGSPNNFERLLELFAHDHAAFIEIVTAMKVSDKKTIAMIKNVFTQEKYLLDFHTAVGYFTAENMGVSHNATVVVSTASPVKFAKEIKRETGITVNNSHILKKLRMKKKRVVTSSNNYDAIKQLLIPKYESQ